MSLDAFAVAGTPEVLQAAGLRLLCRLWHTSGGRAYQQLRAAVIGEVTLLDALPSKAHSILLLRSLSNLPDLSPCCAGYAAPGQSPGLALRVARAECLRDICTADPDKAVELVGLVQVRAEAEQIAAAADIFCSACVQRPKYSCCAKLKLLL